MDGVDESLLAVSPPVHAFVGAPAGFTLNAVLEIHDDLGLSLRVQPCLVHVGRANVPQALLHDIVLIGKRLRPEHVDVRGVGGLIGELS